MNCKHDYLFATEARRRIGENTLAHMLEEIKTIAGMKGDPRIKPHSIRHAAATRLMRNGADIRSITLERIRRSVGGDWVDAP